MTDAIPPAFAEANVRRQLSDMTARADRWMFRAHVAMKLLEDWATAEGPLDPLIERTHTYLEGVKANRAEIDKAVAEFGRLRRYRLSMAENNTWQCRKLEKVSELAAEWDDAPNDILKQCADDLRTALNEDEGQPVYGPEIIEAAFTFRDPKQYGQGDGPRTFEALPGAGFGFVSAAEDKLSLIFDCGGVLACADLPYTMLRAALVEVGLAVVARPFSAREGMLDTDESLLSTRDAKELIEWRAKFSRPDLCEQQLDRLQRRVDDLAADVTRLRGEREWWRDKALGEGQPLGTAELLALIGRAGQLLHDVLYERGCSVDPAITEWLSEPVVKTVTGRGTNENTVQMGPVQGDGASEPKSD